MSFNHEALLVKNITKLMKKDSINDVRIRLNNGVQIEANKIILSAMSPFFNEKFEEKQHLQSSDSFLEIDIDVTSTKEMLELVMEYFYTGKMNIEKLSLRDLLDLLNLLQFLEFDIFPEIVEFTKKKINDGGFSFEKLLILSSSAEAHNFSEINDLMLNYLDLNISDVSKLPEVKYLSSDSLENLIRKKEMDNNNDADEYNNERYFPRFETLASWMRSNEVNEDLKLKFTSMFDLKKFTSHQLTSSVRKSRLFSETSILDVLSHSVINLEDKVEQLEKKAKVLKFSEDSVDKTNVTGRYSSLDGLFGPQGANLKYDLLSNSQRGITYPHNHFGAFVAQPCLQRCLTANTGHQVYTSDAVTQDHIGVITIKAEKQHDGRITSGRLESYDVWSTSQSADIKRRGYVELHVLLPAKVKGNQFRGSWPAIRMLSKAGDGEFNIDIVEIVNGDPRIHMSVKTANERSLFPHFPSYVANADFTKDPLIAGFEWNLQKNNQIDLTWWMSWYDISLHKWVSEHTTKTLTSWPTNPPDYSHLRKAFTGEGFSLLINLAEGGDRPGCETNVNHLPHYMTVLSAKVFGFQ